MKSSILHEIKIRLGKDYLKEFFMHAPVVYAHAAIIGGTILAAYPIDVGKFTVMEQVLAYGMVASGVAKNLIEWLTGQLWTGLLNNFISSNNCALQ